MTKSEAQHYEPEAFWTLLFSVRGTILPFVWRRVVATALIGVFAAWLQDNHPLSWLQGDDADLHQYVTIIIGLFLVFRTNTSYERWSTATKTFARMITTSRVLCTQLHAHIEGEGEEAVRVRDEGRRLIVLLVVLIKQHLREEDQLDGLVRAGLLSEKEREALHMTQRRPALVAQWLRQLLCHASRLDLLHRYMTPVLDAQVTTFLDEYQSAQYFASVQVPKMYAQASKFALVTYAWISPFVFAGSLGWATPVAAAWLGLLLFSLDEMAVQLEMPYGDDDVDIDLENLLEALLDDVAALAADRNHETTKKRHFRLVRDGPDISYERGAAEPLLADAFWRESVSSLNT